MKTSSEDYDYESVFKTNRSLKLKKHFLPDGFDKNKTVNRAKALTKIL